MVDTSDNRDVANPVRSPWAPVSNSASGTTTIASEDGVVEETLVGQTIGSYQVVSLLGRGGIGSVYLAEHPVIGAQVAIKVLHPEFAAMPGMGDRFVREARATNLVPSPHVVRIQDFGQLADGRQYAVMDYLKGAALEQLLAATGPLPLPRALRLLVQAASALAAAHDVGIVHRDVKPDNLFVTLESGAEKLRILDFGIAKLMETKASEGQTVAGMLVGTPAYCAPEQAMQQPVGPPADVYALATVAYEMLAGEMLFTGSNVFELVADKIRKGDVDLRNKASLPEGLRDLLESMLRYAPSARPPMAQVERTLSELLAASEAGQAPQVPCSPAAQSAPPPPSVAEVAAPSVAAAGSPAGISASAPVRTLATPAGTILGLAPMTPPTSVADSQTQPPMTYSPPSSPSPSRRVPVLVLVGLVAAPAVIALAVFVPWLLRSGEEAEPLGLASPALAVRSQEASLAPAPAEEDGPAVVLEPTSPEAPPPAASSGKPASTKPASTKPAPTQPSSTKPASTIKPASTKPASTVTGRVPPNPTKSSPARLVDPFRE